MPAQRRLFGTDGVRGVAGVDLTTELARELGSAAARFAGAGEMIVIGRDTRESGPELEAAVVEGIVAAGGVAVTAGDSAHAWSGGARSPAGGRAGLRHLGLAQSLSRQRHQVSPR